MLDQGSLSVDRSLTAHSRSVAHLPSISAASATDSYLLPLPKLVPITDGPYSGATHTAPPSHGAAAPEGSKLAPEDRRRYKSGDGHEGARASMVSTRRSTENALDGDESNGDIFDDEGRFEGDELYDEDGEDEEDGEEDEDEEGEEGAQDRFEGDEDMSHAALETHRFEASHMRLTSKTVPLPIDGALCTMRIYASLRYDDNIFIRCTSIEEPNLVLALRQISIDQVYDIMRNDMHKEHTSEDYHNLRQKLSRMFRESDKENRGYLTYAEFEKLMDKINIGISAQELRYVISEADENENGYVDYDEFIPLAVDMIVTYDAYVQAEENQKLQEISIDDEVIHQLSQSNLDRIIDEAHRLIQESDGRSSGSIRPVELKRILRSLISDKQSEINDESIVAVCQALKKDPFGRLLYGSFPETMRSVCFTILKMRLIRNQGTELQNFLMDLFEDAERKAFKDESEGGASAGNGLILTGHLPLRQILDLMAASKRLALSRLQVMVIAAPSESEDGLVDYRRFVPTAAKAIDIMFQPAILRRRAELIETQDLSPASLLSSSKDEYVRKLRTLFSAYDLNKSGELNPRQFRAIIEAMDLHLAPSEIMVLMSNADLDSNGAISFEEFVEFCNINLAHLERENHIRQLQEAMNRTDGTRDDAEDVMAMTEHLHHIFKLADADGSGALSYEELEVVFKSVNMHLSHFQLQVLMSEMDVNNDGSVSYDEFVPPLADLLLAYKAKNHAIEEKNKREAWALQKANESSPAWMMDVRKTVHFLYEKLQLVHDSIEDPIGRRNAVIEVLRHPNAALNRTEANMLLARLYPHKGSLDSAVDLSAHTNASNNLILNLENILSDIRRTTIMRGFIEDLPASSVAAHLQTLFSAELERVHAAAKARDGDAFVMPGSLPLSTVFGLLERNTMVRLNRTQILGILSWADCFEEGSSTDINCKRFCRYAADVITKLNSPDQMLRRASVVKHAAFEMNNLLNGATQSEIESYLTDSFTALQKESKILNELHVVDVIRDIPKVNLSDKEAATLAATIPHTPERGYQWKQFIPCAYLATADICRERMIARRLTLMGAAEMNAEDRLALQKLAERLVSVVTLRRFKGRLRIVLPSDDPSLVKRSTLLQVKERRRTRLLSGGSSILSPESGVDDDATDEGSLSPGGAKRQNQLSRSSSKIEGNVDAESSVHSLASVASKGEAGASERDTVSGRTKAYARSHASSAPDSYDIVRVGKRVPVMTINVPGESVEDRMNEIIGGGRIKGESLLLMIKFMENDPLLNPDAAPLKILAIAADGSQRFNLPVTLRLPSVGMVDGEAAKHFARNIIDKLYVERLRRKITLRIYDKKEVI